MAVRVSGKNMAIGEALHEHAQSRIEGAVHRYFEGPISGHVVIETEGSGYRSDMTLHLQSGMTLQVDGRAHEPYQCFDQALDKLERRLRRYKSRLRDRHPVGVAAAETSLMAERTIEQPDAEDEPESYSPVVVAERKMPLKSLSVAAAVSDLDFSGAPVLVFRHAGNGHVNVVYRRQDGNIGWIDPADAADGV